MAELRRSFLLFCVLLSGVAGSDPAFAATVNLCASAAALGTDANALYGPDGKLVTLVVAEMKLDGCESVDLPVPAEALRWYTLTDIPLNADPPRTLSLQGYFDAEDVRISEIIHAQSEVAGEPAFIPFFADMRPYLQVRSFGLEERARVEGERLICDAGDGIAGFNLHAAAQWPQRPGVQLDVTASGAGEFRVAVADPAREGAEQPLFLGNLSARPAAATTAFMLPANADAWTSIVVFCPAGAAHLALDALRLSPEVPAALDARRATWLWSPALWRDSAAAIWELVTREKLGKLFVTVPVTAAGAVEDPDALAAFIAAAATHDVAVWAVIGDPADVLPESTPPLLARAEAYAAFNAAHPATPLAGLQLDIEPYLLPGITLAPDYWRERYIGTVLATHERLALRMPLDVVMPVWWGLHPAWGSRVLAALALPQLSVTVMNYRTDADALRVGAMPFLAWGDANGNKVAMALEKGRAGVNAGNGRDETRIRYEAANAGELWLLELGGMGLLLLLDGDYANLPGRAYVQAGERVVGIDTISFAAAPRDLQDLAARLEAEWSVWTAFGGLAIHGLDQELQAPP